MLHTALRSAIPSFLRPNAYLTRLVRNRTGQVIANGPFAGMRYLSRASEGAYIPKLLGIYERELHYWIESMCASDPDLILNIGAAEGYYAVGMARRSKAKLIAFEQTEAGRTALTELCSLNKVDHRIEIKASCEPDDIRTAIRHCKSALIVCDVEGYEKTLLCPEAIPELRRATILAEMHDFVHPNISELIQARFAGTHSIERIWQEPRCVADFPYSTIYTRIIPARYIEWAVSEWRPMQMSWLAMRPS
jgi:hypothetical protein